MGSTTPRVFTKLFHKEVNVKKKIFSIWSVLLVLIVSIAVLVPGCDGGQGTIEVEATIDGSPWPGALDYTLTPASGSPISGTDVPGSHSADAGDWTCSYDGGGPDGATLVGIATSETQSLAEGGTITFTLNFEIPEPDASVTFLSWTIDGQQVPDGSHTVYPPTIIDAEYDVFVSGNSSEEVSVNQTFWLQYHFKGEAASKTLHVHNGAGAVSTSPPETITSQQCSVGGTIYPACHSFKAWQCEPVKLDVIATWKQQKGTHYTVRVNWIGIPSPDPIAFDIVDPGGSGNFTVYTWACVELLDEEDVDPANDCSANSTALDIEYKPGPPP